MTRTNRIAKVEDHLVNAITSSWCVVDTENEFTFESDRYVIDRKVKQYEVLNKAVKTNGEYNNFTNSAPMSSILVVDDGEELKFFDENFVEISNDLIKMI